MSAARRIKIKFETHELKVIRLGRDQRCFCESCRAETLHLTVSQAAAVLGISEMSVFRLADSRRIHSHETKEGKLLLCGNSFDSRR